MHQTYADRLWQVLLGKHPPPPAHQIPLITSIFYYAVALVSGRLLRGFVTKNIPVQLQPYLLDMVITFQVLCCSLENGQIRRHYGVGAYALVLFTLSMWHFVTITNGSANPCAHMIRYLNKAISTKQFILRVICQTVGGLASYQFAKVFWSLELTESHGERYHQVFCTTDLAVPFVSGFFVEFGGTLLDTLLCLTTFSPFFMMESATKIMMGCGLTLIGINWTGYYLNPINATNQNFGCHGTSALEHFMVYWIGPLAATALGVKLHCWLTNVYHNYNSSSVKRLLQYSPSLTFEEIEEYDQRDIEAEERKAKDAPWEISEAISGMQNQRRTSHPTDMSKNGSFSGSNSSNGAFFSHSHLKKSKKDD